MCNLHIQTGMKLTKDQKSKIGPCSKTLTMPSEVCIGQHATRRGRIRSLEQLLVATSIVTRKMKILMSNNTHVNQDRWLSLHNSRWEMPTRSLCT
ncbi:unnamed protein product, partial [Ixodes persulcatus]